MDTLGVGFCGMVIETCSATGYFASEKEAAEENEISSGLAPYSLPVLIYIYIYIMCFHELFSDVTRSPMIKKLMDAEAD